MSENPLSVIIVEDESLVREHIRLSVDWKGLGLAVVAEASDGLEALRLAEEHRPAIAIVDINIPHLDGIVLSERLRAEQPDCIIIILSGFNEFDYAKRALHAGVQEYLLKPLRTEELELALETARNRFAASIKQRHYIENLEHKASDYPNRELDGRIAALITGQETPDIDVLPGIEGEKACVAVVSIDGCEDRWPDIHEQNRWHEVVLGILKSRVFQDVNMAILGPDGLPVFIAGDPLQARGEIDALRTSMAERFGFTISAGVSGPRKTATSFNELYRTAMTALNEKFFQGLDKTHMAPAPARRHRVLVANKTEIILPLRMGDLDGLIRKVEECISTIIDNTLDYDSVDLMTMEMMAAATQFLSELNLDLDPILDQNGRPWIAIARSRETLEELAAWIVHSFEVVLDHAKEDVRFKTYKVVDSAMTYIGEHFRDKDLTLRKIADAVNTNPTYLSKIFKIQSGFSVIEYLRETRLEDAKALLLRSPASMVFEVAETVGFSDPLYFSRVFKGRYGVSPKKFRRS